VAPRISSSDNIEARLGKDVDLSCTATGDPTPSIWWIKDGQRKF